MKRSGIWLGLHGKKQQETYVIKRPLSSTADCGWIASVPLQGHAKTTNDQPYLSENQQEVRTRLRSRAASSTDASTATPNGMTKRSTYRKGSPAQLRTKRYATYAATPTNNRADKAATITSIRLAHRNLSLCGEHRAILES
jgi:hypothetical protein